MYVHLRLLFLAGALCVGTSSLKVGYFDLDSFSSRKLDQDEVVSVLCKVK